MSCLSQVENVRLKCAKYEMIASQVGGFTLIVNQSFLHEVVDEDEEGGEAKAE